MNQVMINAIELKLILEEIDFLKRENEKLVNLLKDAEGRIRVLKEDVGFAERGYTKVSNS